MWESCIYQPVGIEFTFLSTARNFELVPSAAAAATTTTNAVVYLLQ